MTGSYVQFGCGLSAPEGWLNFDASPRLRFERLPLVRRVLGSRALFPAAVRYGDIVAGLPVADGTVKGLYSSHVLEHLYRSEVETALDNAMRMLAPGGVFRLIVPDLGWRVEDYLRNPTDPDAAERLQHRLHFRPRTPARGIVEKLRAAFGLSFHQWMYDETLMSKLLSDAGFVDIRRCRLGDNPDPAFAAVESPTRFIDEGFDELALECRKPS